MAYDCGVYVITNDVNGHRYVGSAASFKKRFREHLRQLLNGNHHSRYLQRAWDKHGEASFSLKPILYCDRNDLIFYEQLAMDSLTPEYNIAPVAGSQLGYRHSEESRRKMSASRRRNPSSPRKGMTHTEETKRLISESRRGKGGCGWTQQRRDRISAALKGRVISEDSRRLISESLTGRSTGRGSLTPDQVREVRRLKDVGLGKTRIARHMGISQSAASAVIGRHAYLWVT